jgi:hypothetical protein
MARTNAPEGAAILKQPISSHLTSDAVVRTVPLAELAGTLLPFISDEEWDEILNELKSAANGLSPDLDAMQCAVIRDLIRYYRRTAPGSADTDRPMSDHPLSMSMFASKADYEEAKDRFCDNNCTWRDHHPECPRHEDHPLSIAGASGAPISDTEIQRIAGSDELTGDAILRFAGRLLADRGEEIAELRRQLDERGGVVELQRLRIAELESMHIPTDVHTKQAKAEHVENGATCKTPLQVADGVPGPHLSMHPADKLEMDRAFNEVADGVGVPDADERRRLKARHDSMLDRLKIHSGPFKGKSQVWFTRAEVVELLMPKDGERVDAPTVEVERDRVWIKRGVQSFVLAYDSDVEEERQWYAQQLRSALGIGGVRGLVMADGSPLLDYLNVGDDPPEIDEWTQGFHEARRRLYRILAPQLTAAGAKEVPPKSQYIPNNNPGFYEPLAPGVKTVDGGKSHE